MTPGQQRAIKELKRLQFSEPDRFEILEEPKHIDGWLSTVVSLRLGTMELVDGGLNLRERENFILKVPPDFPFDKPFIRVDHDRFARFPHVVWRKQLCLYQSSVEWNPADSLYGFFDRLLLWLKKAALNDMDPYDGPLEPPHHNTDFSQLSFVVRANTPFQVGETWFGLAELKKCPNRMELVGWNDLSQDWPEGIIPALVIVLKDSMPPEFPSYGKGLFDELDKQGIDKQKVLNNLQLAAKLTYKGEPTYIVLALPMRRSPDGKEKFHIAIWSIDHEDAERLRVATPSDKDSDELSSIKCEINDLIYEIIEVSKVSWCRVMEDRDEILVRRDSGTPVSWFKRKKVLVLGCGAIGSWATEIIARSNPELIHLIDNSIVKPGLLSRQNYRLEDIGKNKAVALSQRMEEICPSATVKGFSKEAHKFITEDKIRFKNYELILDCTASKILQMKLERDWNQFERQTPPLGSLVIDGRAKRCIGVILLQNSEAGIWSAYINLKNRLCLDDENNDIVESFYNTVRAAKDLFQPEPGCSDPTFIGSTADIASLVSAGLNQIVGSLANNTAPMGVAFSSHSSSTAGSLTIIKPPENIEVLVGQYRVQICKSVFTEARAWVKQNNRVRTQHHETGGLLWGLWDDAIGLIWIFDASGPPPDSSHDPGHFLCGVEGTVEEHEKRMKQSFGTNGFVGFWHTHPNMASDQSMNDIFEMTELVAHFGQNQKRSVMMIFGRTAKKPTVGIYIYENVIQARTSEHIAVTEAQVVMEEFVV